MKPAFNGTDTTEINLDAECVRLIDTLLEQTSFGGNVVELGDSLDTLFSSATAGALELSHDQLALLDEIFHKARFTRAARAAATRAKAIIVAAHRSFYKNGSSQSVAPQ